MRPSRPLGSRTVGWGLAVAGLLVGGIVLVTWKAQSPLVFLVYPLLVLGGLVLLALGGLWALRHF
jgi:hypothetical protein